MAGSLSTYDSDNSAPKQDMGQIWLMRHHFLALFVSGWGIYYLLENLDDMEVGGWVGSVVVRGK